MEIRFGPDGLIPAIAQDAATGRVLMVAYMNREALDRTIASGDAWYWSRSRERLWRKGETSGHTQRVRAIRPDCDEDALLLVVEQSGPACHTGHASCFYRDLEGDAVAGEPGDVLDQLFALLERRKAEMPDGSYTAALLRGGRPAIAAKVLEEAEEITRAAREESDRRVVEEAADLLYHTWLLLVERGISLDQVRGELARRRRPAHAG